MFAPAYSPAPCGTPAGATPAPSLVPPDAASIIARYAELRRLAAVKATDTWPEAKILRLIDLHQDGQSFGEIAPQIGMSRNATIAKADRMAFPSRDLDGSYKAKFTPRLPGQPRGERKSRARPKSDHKPRGPRPKAAAQVEAPVKTPAPPRPHVAPEAARAALALPGLAPVLISALTPRQCRWPVGDPQAADFAFCGREKGHGPYCTAHHAAGINPEATARAFAKNRDLVKLLRLDGRRAA